MSVCGSSTWAECASKCLCKEAVEKELGVKAPSADSDVVPGFERALLEAQQAMTYRSSAAYQSA